MRYRMKPIDFDAFRWEGQPMDQCPGWFQVLRVTWSSAMLVIRNLAPDGFVALHGDWIVRSQDGNIYPVTDDFLKKVADPIQEAADDQTKGA